MFLPHCLRWYLVFSQLQSFSYALVTCTSSPQCESVLRQGSECVNGFCTNPFYYQGCLRTFFPNLEKIRVCSSNDPPEAADKGYCKTSPWDYVEMRVLAQNWETSFFETWILQIILSKSRRVFIRAMPFRVMKLSHDVFYCFILQVKYWMFQFLWNHLTLV